MLKQPLGFLNGHGMSCVVLNEMLTVSGYEELLRDDKFSVAQEVHYEMSKVLIETQCDLVSPLSTCLYTRYVFSVF